MGTDLEEEAIKITYPLAFKKGQEIEKERILKEINEFKGLFKNRKRFHTSINVRERIIKALEHLIRKVETPFDGEKK